LLQIIDNAQSNLHIVSFAVYRIPAIAEALTRALQRGVQLAIYLESPGASEGKISYDPIRQFDETILGKAQVYVWPIDKRERTPDGKYGSLHAKVALADSHRMLISSANLTEHALTLNMELGLYIAGGPLPRQVTDHLSRLVEQGTFVPHDSI
jgi:cardiolipin synthase